MVQSIRKSTRVRSLTTKAKQLQEFNNMKKPVLRSISTIDENENTYNNINFKKRKITPSQSQSSSDIESDEDEDDLKPNFAIPEEEEEEDLFPVSDNENIFNSDEDDYYTAGSDYDSDNIKPSTKRYLSHSRFFQLRAKQEEEEELKRHKNLSHMKLLNMHDDNLFESDDSDSEYSPIENNFHFIDSNGDLKSLEENFQKIIDENKNLKTDHEPASESESTPQSPSTNVTIDDFVDYSSDVVSSDESEEIQPLNKSSKFLQYRHDENHNLAFPDVSTFPVRFDPTSTTLDKSKKFVRALNRRAILSGRASEMVGIGMSMGEFMMI